MRFVKLSWAPPIHVSSKKDRRTESSRMYELMPTILSDEEYSKVKEERMKVKENQSYHPPIAITPDQLHLYTLLCDMTDTVIDEKKRTHEKSKIGFTVDNIQNISSPPKMYYHTNEIGARETKLPGIYEKLIEEDRTRTAEILKRQLHVRIMKSKDRKEFRTFGMAFSGFDIEFYVMVFDDEKKSPYQFHQIEQVKLPIMAYS
ncbi:hypothetical protein EDC94DRAFT_692268 [Helicostylum pulchrum]|nr:hypothetical protein EDC94DRAFT_692268 [Helicostylum pulchrum]